MSGLSSTRPRRRMRSSAEQMYWDGLSPAERLAFTLGYTVGQGAPFPRPDHIAAIAGQLGVTRPDKPRPVSTARAGSNLRRGIYGTDYALVAEVARDAIAEGLSPSRAVFEAIGCATVKSASVMISRARSQGHDIPYVRPDVATRNARRHQQDGVA